MVSKGFLILLPMLIACGEEPIRVVHLSQEPAVSLTITDTLPVALTTILDDSSMSRLCPVIQNGIGYFPTTVFSYPDTGFGNPPGSTGLVALDLATGDTLWTQLYMTESGTNWPLIGSLGFQNDRLLLSLENGLYFFDPATGECTIREYDAFEKLATERTSEIQGSIFRSLIFTASRSKILSKLYPADYDPETNRVVEIANGSAEPDPAVEYRLDLTNSIVTANAIQYSYQGKMVSYFTTDSSICMHFAEPEMFAEIGVNGELYRLIKISDQELVSCVFPLAAPYEGHTVRPQTTSNHVVYDSNRLYVLHTGISQGRNERAVILEIDVTTGYATAHIYDGPLGWKKFSGDGLWFAADDFSFDEPDSTGKYIWNGRDHYAVFRLSDNR